MRRRLSEEEKASVRDRLLAVESARFPDNIVSIMVNDETDDNGDPIWSVLKSYDDKEPTYGRSPLLKWPGCTW
jgi:hypothetical protein